LWVSVRTAGEHCVMKRVVLNVKPAGSLSVDIKGY